MRTRLTNISGDEKFFGFIPPHGRVLEEDEEITLPGDLRTSLVSQNRYNAKAKAMQAALNAGEIHVEVDLDAPSSSSSSSSSVTPEEGGIFLLQQDLDRFNNDKFAALYRWNIDTGASEEVDSITMDDEPIIVPCIAVDPTTNILYGVMEVILEGGDVIESYLITINKTTAAATLIGLLADAQIISIAFDESGQLYTAGYDIGFIPGVYIADKETAEQSLSFTLGQEFYAIAVNPDGNFTVAPSSGLSVYFYSPSGEVLDGANTLEIPEGAEAGGDMLMIVYDGEDTNEWVTVYAHTSETFDPEPAALLRAVFTPGENPEEGLLDISEIIQTFDISYVIGLVFVQ